MQLFFKTETVFYFLFYHLGNFLTREHICCECIHNCSQLILTVKSLPLGKCSSGVGYNSVCWKQERKVSIFSQISQILAVTGAWCVNEFCIWHLFKSTLSVKISENSPVAFSGLRPMWAGSRFLQADSVLVHPNDALLSIHRDFCASVVDVAWADLMFCEGEMWIFGKTQTVHLGLEWIRIFCVCLLGMTASERSYSLTNSWSVNMGWMPLVYMLTHNG